MKQQLLLLFVLGFVLFCLFVLQYNSPIPQIIIKHIYINAWFRNLFKYTCNTFGVSSTIHCVKICSLGGVAGCCLFVLLFCTLYFLSFLCLCYAFFLFFLIKKNVLLQWYVYSQSTLWKTKVSILKKIYTSMHSFTGLTCCCSNEVKKLNRKLFHMKNTTCAKWHIL